MERQRGSYSRPIPRDDPVSQATSSIHRNGLLSALSAEDIDYLQPRLCRVDLPLRTVLHLPQEPIPAVHFIESGWISLVITLDDGNVSEVGLVGSEGMAGLPLLFGTDRSTAEAMVQAEHTSALRMDAHDFRDALDACPSLRRTLLRYGQACFTQVSQTAACNNHHQTEQRLARWLLTAHDRASGDQFMMTHELLAIMLGVRRASVSLAAGMLQKADLIRYGSGQITILDRPGLEAAACECHGVVCREFRRLLGHA